MLTSELAWYELSMASINPARVKRNVHTVGKVSDLISSSPLAGIQRFVGLFRSLLLTESRIEVAKPMETRTSSFLPECSKLVVATLLRNSSITFIASAGVVSGRTMQNSSPPYLKAKSFLCGLTQDLKISATCLSTSSPKACPY